MFTEFIRKQKYTSNFKILAILNKHVQWYHVISKHNEWIRLTIWSTHLWKARLNSYGKQFHHYQQNEESPLT